LPFEDSRRLTGANLFFASTGVVLETVSIAADEALIFQWRSRVGRARARLGWPDAQVLARSHPGGASLAFAAPYDQLFVATEVNEWALCSALLECDPARWTGLQEALLRAVLEDAADPQSVVPPELEETAAFRRLERLAATEARPALRDLVDAASDRGLPHMLDDTVLTLGAGEGGIDFELTKLPAVSEVPWGALRDIPTALVTGSNGKTTTVRLLASCAQAHGWASGYSSTDGVVVGGEVIANGDYSGPAGARMVIRARRTQAAILETARGGILRRGLAVSRVQAAVVTNVSSDHFGEYGIYDLDALADVKLTVGAAVGSDGLLVLNADDPLLRSKASGLAKRFGRCPPLGWFALDADLTYLREHRSLGGATCGVRSGSLYISRAGIEHDLGPIASMPLTVGGSTVYNIANLGGAALAAMAVGVPAATIASVFRTFGSHPSDNPGRLMQFDVNGVHVVLDYAHNAEGLRGLLQVAQHLRVQDGRRESGRLGILLGHAGNRRDVEIREVARVAAEFKPDLVVVKENEAQLRGREQGEVPRIIRAALLEAGMPESALTVRMTEVEAAECALAWARPGDVLALLVHSTAARAAVLAMVN
jgi:UDP-N-acetylmuramyl tripeptide synthase